MIKPTFVEVSDDGFPQTYIFVHGYSVLQTADHLKELVADLMKLSLRGRVYILTWDAGDFREVFNTPGRLRMLDTYQTFGKVTSVFLNNPLEVISEGFQLAISLLNHFYEIDYRAEVLGSSLLKQIKSKRGLTKYPINFIGHSLGAKYIHWGLASSSWEKVHLQDCIFLAGAADRISDDWGECRNELKGNLINIFNQRDSPLAWLKFFGQEEDRIGNKNLHYAHNYGCFIEHDDYWKNLPAILAQSWPQFNKLSKISNAQKRKYLLPLEGPFKQLVYRSKNHRNAA